MFSQGDAPDSPVQVCPRNTPGHNISTLGGGPDGDFLISAQTGIVISRGAEQACKGLTSTLCSWVTGP